MNSNQWAIDRYVDSDSGQLITYAWPGGYPVVYYDKDYEPLCPDCANKLRNEWVEAVKEYESTTEEDIKQEVYWAVQMCADAMPRYGGVYYEGPVTLCAECNAGIESAYGDPDEENNSND